MFKKFAAAVVLGAIVGAVAYKIKKEVEDKKALDKELDMLSNDSEEDDCEYTIEKKETIVDEIIEEAEEFVEDAKEIVYEVIEDVQEVAEEVKEAVEEKIEEAKSTETKEENIAVNETVEKKTAFLEESFQENPLTANLDVDYKKELDSYSDSNIQKLSLDDDRLSEDRPIQHLIDFKSNEDMETFKSVVIEKGYVVTRGENPYQLSVLHIAPINRSELLVNVYYLANQAIKHNAKYLGWQSRKVI